MNKKELFEAGKILIIKHYSDDRKVIIEGRTSDKYDGYIPTIKKIVKEHNLRNVGRFVVVVNATPQFAYIFTFSDGIKDDDFRYLYVDYETLREICFFEKVYKKEILFFD